MATSSFTDYRDTMGQVIGLFTQAPAGPDSLLLELTAKAPVEHPLPHIAVLIVLVMACRTILNLALSKFPPSHDGFPKEPHSSSPCSCTLV